MNYPGPAVTYNPMTLPTFMEDWGTLGGKNVCVAVLLWHPYGGSLATVTRKDDGNKACLPGGKCDTRDYAARGRCPRTREVLAAAAARELCEETGVDRAMDSFAFLWGTSDYGDGTKFTATMWAMPRDDATFEQTVNLKGEEGTRAMWLTPAALVVDTHVRPDGHCIYPASGAFPDYYRKLFDAIGVRSVPSC